MIYLKLIKESFSFAVLALWSNKLRTVLSLLGVTIGIFTIISVFSVIDSLRHNISDSIEKNLGDDVVYIQKWPWSMEDAEYPWWKYMNRPLPSIDEYKSLNKELTKAEAVTILVKTSKTFHYRQKTLKNGNLMGVSEGFDEIKKLGIQEGRYYTQRELAYGAKVVVIGNNIKIMLFGTESPIGKIIKLGKQKAMVIGVLEKEGDNMFGSSFDEIALIPINFLRTWINTKSAYLNPEIWVKKQKTASVEELKDDIRRCLRPIRGIKPRDEDNFALNQMSMITQGFKRAFRMIDLAGIIIGSFSILVGAFGIANIMFVSVRERTKQIGIQKALGAKNYFVMLQFILESIFLSLMGGVLGLLLVSVLIYFANQFIEMTFILDWLNIVRGIGISFVVGLLSGYIPAKQAAKLNPVVAISSNT